jgi:hypothetical protein
MWPSPKTYWGFALIFYTCDMIRLLHHAWYTAILFGIGVGAGCVWVYHTGHDDGARGMCEYYIRNNMLKSRPSEGEAP